MIKIPPGSVILHHELIKELLWEFQLYSAKLLYSFCELTHNIRTSMILAASSNTKPTPKQV